MSGEFRMEVRKTGRGERNSTVVSHEGAMVRFVRGMDAKSRVLTV